MPLVLLLLGAIFGVLLGVAIAFVPELLEYLQVLIGSDSWPGEL